LNMTGEIFDDSLMEIVLEDNNKTFLVKDARFSFHGMRESETNNKDGLRLVLRQPMIRSVGNVSFEDLYSNDPRDVAKPLTDGGKVDFVGDIAFRINHNDVFSDESGIHSVAYLYWEEINGIPIMEKSVSLIPGDVSEYSKIERVDIPVLEAILSESGLKLLIIIPIVIIAIIFLYRPARRTLNR